MGERYGYRRLSTFLVLTLNSNLKPLLGVSPGGHRHRYAFGTDASAREGYGGGPITLLTAWPLKLGPNACMHPEPNPHPNPKPYPLP